MTIFEYKSIDRVRLRTGWLVPFPICRLTTAMARSVCRAKLSVTWTWWRAPASPCSATASPGPFAVRERVPLRGRFCGSRRKRKRRAAWGGATRQPDGSWTHRWIHTDISSFEHGPRERCDQGETINGPSFRGSVGGREGRREGRAWGDARARGGRGVHGPQGETLLNRSVTTECGAVGLAPRAGHVSHVRLGAQRGRASRPRRGPTRERRAHRATSGRVPLPRARGEKRGPASTEPDMASDRSPDLLQCTRRPTFGG
jgi:hypothetical protein